MVRPIRENFLPSPSTSDIVGNYEHFTSYGISLFVDKKLDDNEKIRILQNAWIPNNNFNFS